MEEQQSQKTGIRSDAQKQNRAREGYDPDVSLDINTRKDND